MGKVRTFKPDRGRSLVVFSFSRIRNHSLYVSRSHSCCSWSVSAAWVLQCAPALPSSGQMISDPFDVACNLLLTREMYTLCSDHRGDGLL